MKLREFLFLSFSEIKKNKNTILLFLFAIIFTTLLLFYTSLSNSLSEYWEKCINKNIEYRTFFIYPDLEGKYNKEKMIEKIKQYSIVVDVQPASSKSIACKLKNVKNADKTSLTLIGTIDEPIKIIAGENMKNYSEEDNVLICPKEFYPYEYSNESYNSNLLFNLETKIGEKLIVSPADSNEAIPFKIVGIFDTTLSNNTGNYCYAKFSVVNKLNTKYLADVYKESDDKILPSIVVIDNAKNSEKFIKKIEKDGFISGGTIKKVNIQEGETIINILLLFSIVFALIYFALCITINIKEYFSNRIQYGIYKTMGYTNNDITNIFILKQSIIFITSMMFSIINYLIIILFFKKYIERNVIILKGIDIRLDITSIIITIFINISIIVVFKFFFKHKIEKQSTIDLLKR